MKAKTAARGEPRDPICPLPKGDKPLRFTRWHPALANPFGQADLTHKPAPFGLPRAFSRALPRAEQ